MASNSKPFGLKIHGYISDTELESKREECKFNSTLRNRKRSAEPNDSDSEENDEQIVYPESLLSVEVKESDEIISPADLNKKRKRKRPVPPLIQVKKSVRIQNRVKAVPAKIFDFVEVTIAPDCEVTGSGETKKEIRCDICKKTFKKRSILKKHELVHQGDNKCSLCGVSFRNSMSLGKHIVTVHEQTEKCLKCPATFHTKEQLEEHNRKNEHKIKTEGTENIYLERTDSSWCEELNDLTTIRKSDVNYDIQTAIVSKIHKATPIKDICRLYNVTPEVVNEIWSERDKFILPSKLGRRTISYVNKVLEPPLLEWYNKEKSKDSYITGRMMQNIAEKIAREKGFVHFTASGKWLERFKKKYKIYLSVNKRDMSKLPQVSVWKSKFFTGHWQQIRPKYTDDEIYTADEVGLFYNSSKSRERKFAGKKFVQGEMEDRLSVFLCTNISGSDKRRMLVCGTDDPLKNSNRHPSTLPVEYKRHSRCHFTTDMFEEYVEKWNAELEKNDKKAILLIDRASIHTKLRMSHLELEFLPWKALNTLMPIRNGVYAKFRSEFRNLLLQFKVMNVIKGQDRNLTCLEALELFAKAWDQTPPNVITKSFLDIGFEVQKVDSTEINESTESEKLCEFLKDYDVEPHFTDVNTLDMYLTVEENLCMGRGTRPNVFGGNHKVKEEEPLTEAEIGEDLPLNTGTPISDELESLIRKTRPVRDLEIVREIFETTNVDEHICFDFLVKHEEVKVELETCVQNE